MSALVSVVVPTWNSSAYLRETLDSVLAQRWSPLELIVCDDGSTDDTLELVASYGARVRALRQENRGVSAARNRGAAQARGEYLAFLDHDDVWEPELLSTLVPLLAVRPAAALAYADSYVIDGRGVGHGRRGEFLRYAGGQVFADLLVSNFVPVETTVIRTAAFKDVGGFDESLRYVEDWDLALRLARKHELALHREPLARYRVHGANLSRQLDALIAEEVVVLERLIAPESGLSPDERALAKRQRARRLAALAWRALRRDDRAQAAIWMQKGGARAPLAWRARVALLGAALRVLPAAVAQRVLAALPPQRLYGVPLRLERPAR